MAWSDINASRRNNITDLLGLKEKRRERFSNDIGQGMGAIFDAVNQNRKYKEGTAAAEAERQHALDELDIKNTFEAQEGALDRDAQLARLQKELEARARQGALDRAAYGQKEEEEIYPTSLPWIMSEWDTFSNMLGVGGTDEYGNQRPDPTNEDYKTFRAWIETLLNEMKYPDAERQEALNNLSEYLSDKYIITPGEEEGDRKEDGGGLFNGESLIGGGSRLELSDGTPALSLPTPVDSSTGKINGFEIPNLNEFETPEDYVPSGVGEKEKEAYQAVLDTIQQYGSSTNLEWFKDNMEKSGTPVNWENFLKQLYEAIEIRKAAHIPVPEDSPLFEM